MIISARGGLQQRPVSTGHAYFSKTDDMANHLAMNTIYSYIRSLIQNSKEPLIKYLKVFVIASFKRISVFLFLNFLKI